MDATKSSGAEPAPNGTDTVSDVRAMMADPVAALPITKASVRVMRSHDYCHFEVVLGSDAEVELTQVDGSTVHVRKSLTVAEVDELRKTAARLVDKAVEQFKVLKERANEDLGYLRERFHRTAAKIERDVPETERTPQQMAIVKCAADDAYWANRDRDYDYEDDAEPHEYDDLEDGL